MNIFLLYLQTLLFFLLPIILGRGLVNMLNSLNNLVRRSQIKQSEDETTGLATNFLLGSLLIFGWGLFCHYILRLNPTLFKGYFFGGIWFYLGLSVVSNLFYIKLPSLKVMLRVLLTLAGIFILSLFSFKIWLINNPYPLNWDWYQHEHLARLIQNGHFSFYTSQMSDTFGFNSYPPVFHSIVAVTQYPLDMSPTSSASYWQLITLWHLMFLGVATWLFAYKLAKVPAIAWIATIISLLTFDSVVSLTTYFFLPQSLAAVLFIFAFGKLLSSKRLNIFEVLVNTTGLVLIHYLVGGFSALILLGVFIYKYLYMRFPKFLRLFPWITLAVLICIIWFILAPFMELDHLNNGEAANYIQTIPENFQVVERTYGYFAYIFVILSLFSEKLRTNKSLSIMLGVGLGLGILIFSQTPYVLKLMTILRFFIVLLVAIGIWELVKHIKFLIPKILVIPTLTFCLISILITNLIYWRAGIMYQGSATHIQKFDIKAADYLRSNYRDSAVLLVSDPSTQFILEGLSGIDSLGGAYIHEDKRKVILSGLDSRNAEDIISEIKKLEDDIYGKPSTILLAISGRTYIWAEKEDKQRLKFSYNVWSPSNLTLADYKLIEQFSLLEDTKIVYTNPYLVIIEVN